MTTALDGPSDDEEQYLAKNEDIGALRPLSQGDVFQGITLPGFPAGDHDTILLSSHPCSLRAGANLKPRLQAVPVRAWQRVPPSTWPDSHLRVFPLPGLAAGHAAAVLTESGVVTPAQLGAAKRIAVMSERGTLLLQQRIIWAMAHAKVGIDTLEEFSAPAFAELELLEYWNELLCDESAEQDLDGSLKQTATAFEQYLRASGLHQDLQRPESRGDARRKARSEAQRRQQARPSTPAN